MASIIAAAKQASANVLIAQQQVQAAKDNVLNQQKMAYEKEAQATMAQQKSEAQAAVLRSDAAGAAQSVILAQVYILVIFAIFVVIYTINHYSKD